MSFSDKLKDAFILGLALPADGDVFNAEYGRLTAEFTRTVDVQS